VVDGGEPVARAVGPVVGKDRAVAELVPLEEEAVRGLAVVLDVEVEEFAGFVDGIERDAESASVPSELRGATLLVDAIDDEPGEVERDLTQVRGPDREDNFGLGANLFACLRETQTDAVLLRVEPRLSRLVVARLRVWGEEAEAKPERPR
jgi:hypothetical protein